jgi:hypothetical protein
MKDNPAATTFIHAARNQIYVFVRGDNDNLFVCFWDASPDAQTWKWADLTHPDDATIDSSPTALTFRVNFNASEHFLVAFVKGNNGHLNERHWNGFAWDNWLDRSQPHYSLAAQPAAVTFYKAWYTEDAGWASDVNESLSAFVWASDDRLYRFDLRDNNWVFQGELPQSDQVQPVVASAPAVMNWPRVNYPELNVYVVGSNAHLYANFSTAYAGTVWEWRDLLQPLNTPLRFFYKPSLVRFTFNFEERIHAYVVSGNGHLWEHLWKGYRDDTVGIWADRGTPTGATVDSECAAISLNFQGTDRIYAFVRGSDDQLHVCYWDGSRWGWTPLGRPTSDGHDVPAIQGGGNTPVSGPPSVVTFPPSGQTNDQPFVFVRGGDKHLHTCFFNGSDWLWNDLGVR